MATKCCNSLDTNFTVSFRIEVDSLLFIYVFFFSKLQESSRPYCTLCEYAIGEMDKLITDKKNMYQVKAALDRICYELSSPIQKQCLKMIDEYTDEIIQMFVNEVIFF